MMKELQIGFCPVCGDTMFDICHTCQSYIKTDNCMQITLEMDIGRNTIPICNKCVKNLDLPTAQQIYDMGIIYNVKNGIQISNPRLRVVKILWNTMIKQKDVR